MSSGESTAILSLLRGFSAIGSLTVGALTVGALTLGSLTLGSLTVGALTLGATGSASGLTVGSTIFLYRWLLQREQGLLQQVCA